MSNWSKYLSSIIASTNRFHWMVGLCWQLSFFFSVQQIFPIFSSYVPQWRCIHNGSIALSQFNRDCAEFELCKGSSFIQFENNLFYSAAIEYNWVCGPTAYLASLFAQLQFVGVLVGTLLFGSLSDFYGRKPVSIIGLIIGILSLILSGFAIQWQVVMILRFFVGFSIGSIVVVFTYTSELLLPEQRMPMRAFFNWGVARLMLTIVCFLFPHWRTASIACAVCSLPALLLVILVFPESPTFLHSVGKLEQMRANEKRIAWIGGVKYQEMEYECVVEQQSFFTLLKNKSLCQRVLVLWTMWFTAAICAYATDLNSSTISGNLFLNQAFFAIILIISKFFLIPFDAFSFSRRNLHQYSQLAAIICFVLLTCLLLIDKQGLVILIVNTLGMVFIQYTWDACFLCAIEGIPTGLRSTSIATCNLVEGIGGVLAPTLAFLNTFWAPSVYLTVTIVGSICLFISYQWLVETRGIDLNNVKLNEEAVVNKSHLKPRESCSERK